MHLVTVLTRIQLLATVVKEKFLQDPIVIVAWNAKTLICVTRAFRVSEIDAEKLREHLHLK